MKRRILSIILGVAIMVSTFAGLTAFASESNCELQNLYHKLNSGQPVYIDYIGGSITQGSGASNASETSWVALVADWFNNKFGEGTATNAEISNKNAGIGATGSYFGSYRLPKYARFDTAPSDLLFIEFALNDAYDHRTKTQVQNDLESMILQTYKANPYANIVLLFTTDFSRKNKDYDALVWHKEIAEHYDIPYIYLGAPLWDKVVKENGGKAPSSASNEIWRKYVTDDCHPNDVGYAYYASLITDYLEKQLLSDEIVRDNSYTKKTLPSKTISNTKTLKLNTEYANFFEAGFTDSVLGDWEFIPQSTYITCNKVGGSFKFKFTGTAVAFWCLGLTDGGKIEYTVKRISDMETVASGENTMYIHTSLTIPCELAVGLDMDTYLVEVTLKEGQYGSRGRLCSILVDGDASSIQPYSEETEALLKSAAENYLKTAGNSASSEGLKKAINDLLGAGNVEQFFIKHAVDGVYDEATDYPISIPGHDGYVSAVVSAYGSKVGVISTIVHSDKNLGTLTTDVFSTSNPNFTLNNRGYITGYTGAAQKIVIPENYSGMINWASTTQNSTVKAMVIGGADSEMTLNIGTNFKKFASLYVLEMPKKMNGIVAVGAFSDCEKLKYVKLPHNISYQGRTTLNNEVFKDCESLETAYCTCCGKMPEAVYGTGVFTNTAIKSYYLPQNYSLASGVKLEDTFGKTPSFSEGETVVLTAQQQKEANITRAATLAQEKAYEYILKENDTAETVKQEIISSFNSLNGTSKYHADWGGTFKKTAEKAKGILSLSGDGATIQIDYYYNPSAGILSLDISGYTLTPEFDPEINEYSLKVPFTVEDLKVEARPVYGAYVKEITGYNNLSVGDENSIVIKTVTPSGSPLDYTVKVERLEDKTELNNKVKKAFEAYIDKVGNKADINGILAAVNEAIAPAKATLSEEEFFIRHAVDGVFDDDPDESTKLSIPGHDGYVSAVFRISEDDMVVSILGTVYKISHIEENLGILTKSADEDFVVDENGNLIDYTGDAQKVIIPSFVKNIKSTGAKKNAGLKKAVVLVTKNSGYTMEVSAFQSAKDGSYGWVNLIAADISNNKLFKERAFSGMPSLKYLKLPSNGGGQYLDYASFADNLKLENVNFPGHTSLLGNVFYNTAVRDIYEGNGIYRPRKDKYDDYGSPAFKEGTRVVMTYSEQQLATFTRAATLAKQAADNLVLTANDDAATVLSKIISAYKMYNDKITADWNGTFVKNGDKANGILTLQYKDARINIAFERDNSKTLKDMYIHDYSLTPEFSSDTYDYSVTVKNSITALAITTILEPGAQIVSVEGNKDFVVGDNNKVVITLKAANGQNQVYTISVTRLEPKTYDEIVADINNAVSNADFTNDSVQADLQKLIAGAIKGEPFTADISDFYKYKSIAGATENGNTVLVAGHNGYITATVNVVGAGENKEIAIKATIKPFMEDYTFASVSAPDDFQLSEDGKTLYSYEGTAEKVVIPDGVEFIDELYLYTDAPGIKCMILPDSVRSIPSSLCYGMTDLEVFYMGDNVVELGAGIFMNCASLKYVRLSENLPEIGSTMFSHTLSLAQLYIPQSVTKIKTNAFYRSLVREITLPERVTFIDENAFSWCINNATYFSQGSLGAIVSQDKGKQIQNNIVSKWAYNNGVNVPRTITILNDSVELDSAVFAGDETGAWGINAVRAPADSTVSEYMASQSDSGSGAPAKKKFTVLNMNLTEAAARAQITADGIHFEKDTTAEEVKAVIDAAYLGDSIVGTEWLEKLSVKNNNVTGKLLIKDKNGTAFEVIINTKVFVPAKPIIKQDDSEINDEDYIGKDDSYFDNEIIPDNYVDTDTEISDTIISDEELPESADGEWKTVRKKIRVKMRRPGTEEFYIPIIVWILIGVGAVLLVAAVIVTIILIKRKKAKTKRLNT